MTAKKKKKKAEHHINHERWMVSYADFVTLLFAVFVVLYATAQSNKNAPRQVSESVTRALKDGAIREAIRMMRSEKAPDESQVSPTQPGLKASLESLNQKLAEEIESG